MAVGKEIRSKIASIKNTQKITRAMEMVAASKMRKTKDRTQETRPYSKKISQIINHLLQANPEYKHPFMIEREVKMVGLIVVSSDRGLCGGLNANLFRRILQQMQKWRGDNIGVEVGVIGSKGGAFFGAIGCNIIGEVSKLGDTPSQADIIGVIK